MTDAQAPAPAVGEGARRGRWTVLLLAAAAVTGVVALPVWVRGEGPGALGAAVRVDVAGAAAAPQVPAAALVLLAAAGAVLLVGAAGRRVVAVVVLGAGALTAAGGTAVLRDPGAGVAAAVADVSGVLPSAPLASATPAPVLAVLAGVLVAVLGVALLRAPGRWDGRSRRHERPVPGGPGPSDAEPDERADWDALSRGDDPS